MTKQLTIICIISLCIGYMQAMQEQSKKMQEQFCELILTGKLRNFSVPQLHNLIKNNNINLNQLYAPDSQSNAYHIACILCHKPLITVLFLEKTPGINQLNKYKQTPEYLMNDEVKVKTNNLLNYCKSRCELKMIQQEEQNLANAVDFQDFFLTYKDEQDPKKIPLDWYKPTKN